MPATDRRYCAGTLRWAGREAHSPITDDRGRVVVFDTKQMASDFFPLLGSDRLDFWSVDGETVNWQPLVENGWNEGNIITGYDPYDVPNGWRALGVYSEAEGMSWKHHVMWHEVRDQLAAWADRRNAGAYPLPALTEEQKERSPELAEMVEAARG